MWGCSLGRTVNLTSAFLPHHCRPGQNGNLEQILVQGLHFGDGETETQRETVANLRSHGALEAALERRIFPQAPAASLPTGWH